MEEDPLRCQACNLQFDCEKALKAHRRSAPHQRKMTERSRQELRKRKAEATAEIEGTDRDEQGPTAAPSDPQQSCSVSTADAGHPPPVSENPAQSTEDVQADVQHPIASPETGAPASQIQGAAEVAAAATSLAIRVPDPAGPFILNGMQQWESRGMVSSSQRGPSAHDLRALPALARRLLPPLMKLHPRDRDVVLKTITDPGFTSTTMPFKTVEELHSFLDKQQDWESALCLKEKLPGHSHETEIHFWRRTNLTAVLQEMLLRPEAHGMAFKASPTFVDGQRVYHDLASAEWMENTEVRVRVHDPNGHVLPLLFYSDGAELERNGRKFHPLLMYVASYSLPAMRSKHGFARIALFPVLSAAKLDFRGDPARFTKLTRRVRYFALSMVMKELKDLGYRGIELDCFDGRKREFYPVPAAYVGDLVEAASIFDIRAFPSHRPDVNFLIHKDEMGLVDPPLLPRTEEAMGEIRKQAIAELEKTPPNKAASDAILDSYGLLSVRQPALAGFRFTDVHKLYHTDILHQSEKGVYLTVAQITAKLLDGAQLLLVDQNIKTLKGFPGFVIATSGFSDLEGKSTATEMGNLFAALPVALTGVWAVDPLIPDCIAAITGLLEWAELRDLSHHTRGALAMLEMLCKRAKELCLKLSTRQASQFCFPKFLRISTFGITIRDLGSAQYTSTSFGERSHGLWNQAQGFTNRHTGEETQQMLTQNIRVEAAEQLHIETTSQPRSQSVAQKAGVLRSTLLNEVRIRIQFSGNPPLFASLFSEQQAGESFEALLKLHAAGYPSFLGSHDDVAAQNAALPQVGNGQILVASSMGIPQRRHRGNLNEGIMAYSGHKNIEGNLVLSTDTQRSFVSVRGENDETWIGQIRLLFRYVDKFRVQQSCVYLRWLEEAPSSTAMQQSVRLTRLRWAKSGVGRNASPHYDVVQLDRILALVCLQLDPKAQNHYYHNRFLA